jgi:signal transduction histidine kinase
MKRKILLLVSFFLVTVTIFLLSFFFFPASSMRYLTVFVFFLQIFLVIAVNIFFINFKLKKVQKTLEAHTGFLEKRIRQKDDFISMTSHELKTPITSVKAFTQMLIRHTKDKDEFSYKYLQKIDQQTNMLTTMINDFLDVSRIQTGKMAYHRQPFYYHDLIIDVVDQMRQISCEHKIILKGKTERWIYADRQRICQVLINLISNAIKYSPGGKKVIIRVRENRKYIITEVQDFGIGIDSEDKKYIFNRFYQAHRNNDVRFTGLGLGLYISSEIIDHHKALIKVKSKKGEGSTFSISIPIYKHATT